MNPWWESEFKFIGVRKDKYLDILKQNLNNKDILKNRNYFKKCITHISVLLVSFLYILSNTIENQCS